MAAILTDRRLSPLTGSPTAIAFAASRGTRSRSIELSEMLTTLWKVAAAWQTFLWMLGVVAVLLLMTAGATGLLAQ